MIEWCKDHQRTQAENKLKAKTLFENNKIDVYDEDIEHKVSEPQSTLITAEGTNAYGNNRLIGQSGVGNNSTDNGTLAHPAVEDRTEAITREATEMSLSASEDDEADSVSVSLTSEVSN